MPRNFIEFPTKFVEVPTNFLETFKNVIRKNEENETHNLKRRKRQNTKERQNTVLLLAERGTSEKTQKKVCLETIPRESVFLEAKLYYFSSFPLQSARISTYVFLPGFSLSYLACVSL